MHQVCRVNVRDHLVLTVVETVLEQRGVADDSSYVSHLAHMGIYACDEQPNFQHYLSPMSRLIEVKNRSEVQTAGDVEVWASYSGAVGY